MNSKWIEKTCMFTSSTISLIEIGLGIRVKTTILRRKKIKALLCKKDEAFCSINYFPRNILNKTWSNAFKYV